MNKRGISPLIASVFIVGLAIILGTTVFISMNNFTKSEIELQENLMESARIVRFSAWSPKENFECENFKFNSCYKLFIENKEDTEVSYYIVTKGKKGEDFFEEVKLNQLQIKAFEVIFDKEVTGEDIVAEVIPITR